MSPAKPEKFELFDEALARRGWPLASPWSGGVYEPDWELLRDLLDLAFRSGSSQAAGIPAAAVDAWTAHELRRAGFDPDEVWPRATRPRVLTKELVDLAAASPKKFGEELLARISNTPKVAPATANILGRVYVKQADVLIAHWARGPELLVSTKTMLSSYGKNLRNRFEEAYGDAKNVRGRFPLVALGFLFLVRSDIPPGDLLFAHDMLRKLTDESDVYDTAALLVVEWDEEEVAGGGHVTLRHDLVEDEQLRAGTFLATLVERVLDNTPINHHLEVRNRLIGAELPVADDDFDPEPDEGQERLDL